MKNYQNKLFPYAYNILGSSEDAKDAVQDCIEKFLATEKTHIKNETGYLIKMVINQSINIKKKKSKTTVNSIWLPEPLATENADTSINQEDIISYTLLVLLEKLTPKERAVFILKEAFDYSHKNISEITDFTIENSRKLLSRAKIKLALSKTETVNYNPPNTETYLKNYVSAFKNGDIKGLEKMLSEDISLYADGGKDIKVVRAYTTGRTACIKLLRYVHKTYLSSLTVKTTTINHLPAILFYQDNNLINCQVFEFENQKIKQVFSIVDPEKLKFI